jgi:hypothetical protein
VPYLILGLWLATAVRGQTVEEYRVKAAFLFNFAKFVSWPPEAFKSAGDPIAICVVGKDPFDGALEQAVRGQTVEGKPFAVRQVPDAKQMGGCHIAFVSSAERKRLSAIFQETKTSCVLTVGESENFTDGGGVVNFRIEDGKVRIQINLEAAGQHRLRISSKLLGVAEIVRK